MQAIVDLVEFIMANTSHTPNVLGSMTLPQVNAIAESIRRFKIHAWGIGFDGDKNGTAKQDDVVEDPTIDDIMAFAAKSTGG